VSRTPSITKDYTFVSPSPIARRLLWHVLGTGRTWISGPVRQEPFINPGAVLLWVESGTGTLEMGQHRCRLERGPKLWLFKLVKPRLFTPARKGQLVISTIRFSGPGLEPWLEVLDVTHAPEFTVGASQAAEVRALYPRLQRWVNEYPPRWERRVHGALTSVLDKLLDARKLLLTNQTDLPESITRALNAIAVEPFRDWRARELAARAGLNYASFRALFRQHLHETIHEHL